MNGEESLDVLLFAGRLQLRGSSAYTVRLTLHLGEHRVVPRVIAHDARVLDAGRRSHLPLREYPYLDVPIWNRVVLNSIAREFADQRPDLIHIQSRDVLRTGEWLAGRLGCPYVMTVHDHMQSRERLRCDTVLCRKIIAVSDSVKTELLSRVRLPEERITVIHSGVDTGARNNVPPVLDPEHVPVVGTAGPLEAVKGLPYFLGAAARVLSTGRNVLFLVAGAGPEEANLRRIARELRIADQVTFAPNLHDFTQSLAAMDIFCLPSLKQGLGTIMLEAMALARPVIATGVGGVYSIIQDQRTGLVVPPSDSERLAEKIIGLLDDPVQARVIGSAGQQLVREKFQVQEMVRRTVAVYRQVLADIETSPQFLVTEE